MSRLSNLEFITALFGDDAPWVHVTDFQYDPGNIPPDRHMAAWVGDYFSRYTFGNKTNQYFTISCFYADDADKARRRKALFRHTNVIVLDDVKEKLPMSQVEKLPEPTYILETSEGSEQWGYLLDSPCADRHRVENLLDGLVAQGLAPDGKDPGMKGVTRYVRLPEGVNNKAKRLIDGEPFQCNMLKWEPTITTTLEALAEPFAVDLDFERREGRIDGAAEIDNHPLLSIPDILKIKSTLSKGRYEVECPWVDEHTGSEDNGAAIFTNDDGSIGFKCHHGACQERTGKNLLSYIEETQPDFSNTMKDFQVIREFSNISIPGTPSVMAPASPVASPVIVHEQPEPGIRQVINVLKVTPNNSPEAMDLSARILKVADTMSQIEKINIGKEVCATMGWNQTEFKSIISGLRKEWYEANKTQANFFSDTVYVAELNQFYNPRKRIFYTTEAYQNTHSHIDAEAKKQALEGGATTKVDRLDYAPLYPRVFVEDGITFANTWNADSERKGIPGDVSRYLDHFVAMGWEDNREHILQWLAFTLRHPDVKINHMLLFGSPEGAGKDFLLKPLVWAMNNNHLVIAGEELLRDFDDYIFGVKYLHINEAELSDRHEAVAISNKLKPLAAAPPDKLRVNQKGIKPIQVRNIVNVSMTTNSQTPLRLNGPSRRFYALWSDLNVRDEQGNMTDGWKSYWNDRWTWMNNGGAAAVVDYLVNHVDLTDFNPGEAPPVTDFMRDIQESSKPPVQQTIEAFMEHRAGCFHADVTTVADLGNTLRAAELREDWSGLLQIDSNRISNTLVGRALRDIVPRENFLRKASGKHRGAVTRYVVLRNMDKYRDCTGPELEAVYNKQVLEAKNAINPVVIK